jgi:ubiquitin-protein ligase
MNLDKITKKNINYILKNNYELNDDSITININSCIINVLICDNKILYITLNEYNYYLSNIIEEINLNIEKYEKIIDVIFEINKIKNNYVGENIKSIEEEYFNLQLKKVNNMLDVKYFSFNKNYAIFNLYLPKFNNYVIFNFTWNNIIKGGYKLKLTSETKATFKNNLLNQIMNLNVFTGNITWKIKYDFVYIINKIKIILNTFGEIDINKNINYHKLKLLTNFYNKYTVEILNIFDDECYNNKKSNGTGYGGGNYEKNNWNIDDYVKNQKQNEINIIKYLKLYLSEITINEYNDETQELFKYILISYSENEEIKKMLVDTKNTKIQKIIVLNDFQKIFWKYKFYNVDTTTNFMFKNIHTITNIQIVRLQKEMDILNNSLPIENKASIFFTINKNNNNIMRFIINGPEGTPYELGLFIFDMTIDDKFPSISPKVLLSNNGNVRFNPNLYNSGKVCLSLLGTWTGDKTEVWNTNLSTIYQILISIQSQILIDEPYFNEPGYQNTKGTSNGTINSTKYNNNIIQYTLEHAMINLIKNGKQTYPEIYDLIVEHFKYYYNNIIVMLEKWKPIINNSIFNNKINEFIEIMNSLN